MGRGMYFGDVTAGKFDDCGPARADMVAIGDPAALPARGSRFRRGER
jgi:hypothetical protein